MEVSNSNVILSENVEDLAGDADTALKLHDEINRVLREKNIDRFSKYAVPDQLAVTAIERVKNREGKRVPAKFSIGYWKAWTSTRDVLEHHSAEHVRKEEENAKQKTKHKGGSHENKPLKNKKKASARHQRMKGVSMGPHAAEKASAYLHIDPYAQPAVDVLYSMYNNRPPPIDLNLVPKPIVPSTFKGGAFTLGPPRSSPVKAITASCELMTPTQLMGPIGKKAISFTNENRFKPMRPVTKAGSYVGPNEFRTEEYQGKFSKGERLVGEDVEKASRSTPGPQEYNVPGIFDKTINKDTDEIKTHRLKVLKGQRALRDSTATQLSRIVTFGYGCSLEEHRKYGLCLDGMCGRRGRTEDVILLTNKDDLFKGFIDETKLKQSKSVYASPMQAAVISGDFKRVQKLVDLGYDINEIDPVTGRTAIHEAVLRGYSELVIEMCKAYAVISADHPVHKKTLTLSTETPRLDEQESIGGLEVDILNLGRRDVKVMRLDIVDNNGDSVFHIAARQGQQEILEIICDNAVHIVDTPNKKGEYPTDIAKTHVLFQLLSICNDRVKLQTQLKEIKSEKKLLAERKKRNIENRVSGISKADLLLTRKMMSSSAGTTFSLEPARQNSTSATPDSESNLLSLDRDDPEEEDNIFEQEDRGKEVNNAMNEMESGDSLPCDDEDDRSQASHSTQRSKASKKSVVDRKGIASKYRRHSFRVGYFVDDEEAARSHAHTAPL